MKIRRPLFAASLGLVALGGASAVVAAPAPPFQALLAQSRLSAPRSVEAQAGVAQARGLVRQAAVLPNPVVSLQVENFNGSGPYRGRNAAESTAMVGQLVELGGKRSARIGAARAEVSAAEARAIRTSADYAFDLAEAYAQAEAAGRREQIATDALTVAQEDSRVASAFVRAGKEADVRAVQARAALQSATADLNAAQAEKARALAGLSALAGSEETFSSIPTSLLTHADRAEPVPEIDPLKTPAYLAAEAAREVAARQVRVERARGVPDVTVSVGARRFELDNSSALVAGVSAPLPLFDRNRGAVSASRAELTAAEARLNAARLDAIAEAGSAKARLSATISRIAAAGEAEQAAAEAARLARVGYEGGKLSLLELLTARRAVNDARRQFIDAQVERVAAEAAIARLQGATPFGDPS